MTDFGYRRMFETEPYFPDIEALKDLAKIMSGAAKFYDRTITRSGESLFSNKIPAGYTYLAQFITHDITFDSRSERHNREDRPFDEWGETRPEDIEELTRNLPRLIKDLRNKRQPNLNLETIYGHETPVNENETPRRQLMQENSELPLLKVGKTKCNRFDGARAKFSFPCDLPRQDGSPYAQIVDPRNDENLLLAQTQVAFIKFHNALVVNLKNTEKFRNEDLFEIARKMAIRYYQTIVLKDFLPRVIKESVWDEVEPKEDTELLFKPTSDDSLIPLEFSVAAFRFAHSMIRNFYVLNEKNTTATLGDLAMFTGRGMNLENQNNPWNKQLNLPSVWLIDWNLFYEIDREPKNFAEPIDTKQPMALMRLLPKAEHTRLGMANSLAAFDLFRARKFGLPSGQDVAKQLSCSKLESEDLEILIKNKEFVPPTDLETEIKKRLMENFCEKTPLWFYILAEAEVQNDGKLGETGSKIVAETIIKLIYWSDYSILRLKLESDEENFFQDNKISSMPEMLKFIQNTAKNEDNFKLLYPEQQERFDELNPLGAV